MCEWHGGSYEGNVVLTIRRDGKKKRINVDRCIAELIAALNEAGFYTEASCCGHGIRPITIALTHNRWLIICNDEQRQEIDRVFPSLLEGTAHSPGKNTSKESDR